MRRALLLSALLLSACSGSNDEPATTDDGGTTPREDVTSGVDSPTADTVVVDESGVPVDTGVTDTGPPPIGAGGAAAVAKALRGKTNFLIGMGNDLASNHDNDGVHTLGVTLDLHYAYLVGLAGSGGWPDWNSGGTFVNIITDSSDKHGVTPMFTLYQMAAWGDGNLAGLADDGYMKAYWDGVKLMFQRLGVFGKPAVVQFEPDFWAYLLQQKKTTTLVKVKAFAPDCADLTNDPAGMGHCLVRLARKYAPKTLVGFHVSSFGTPTSEVVAFHKSIGADTGDLLVIETLDRDAGCFEAKGPECTRTGSFYWDETNTKSPNFKEHLTWAKSIHDGLGLPLLWWQMPFGVPSTTPGGTPGHYRDNRVKYLFAHVDEFVAAGGVGAVFGTGAGNQTYITTDGNQFKNAVTKYFSAPTALP